MSLNVELLEQSFEQIKPEANQFVESFYHHLLTDNPDAKPLFAHTDMKKQRQMLLQSLVFTVENLRNPDALSETLKGLGTRHVKYGALPAHYPLVGGALLKTFEQYLGDGWTPEVKQAWIDAYQAITNLMLEGADASAVAAAQLPAEEPEAGGLNVELLEQSFEKIKPEADAFVEGFYDNLFTDNPEAKPLFEHTDMKKQKAMLLQALVFTVENLRNPDALSSALKGMGARHVKYGALPAHYPLVGGALLKTFEQKLGSEWTEEVKQAWVAAYGAISELMLEGAEYDKADTQLS